ncbi:MAG: hypothetical protein A4E28_00937 [Methanocella sp. PtaU1.Bin125]|nr:MAG: hypothetical protein A4E28_00937 [Methanocella sp. PtaU1.Bin125]
MPADDFSVTLAPVEDMDGGGSRTHHVILKRRYASLAQSAFSCRIHDKIAPNRDYPYEGLFCLSGSDNWKFIDTIALGLRRGEEWLTLSPEAVRAWPWKCEYVYGADGISATAAYYLFEADGGAGVMDVSLKGRKADKTTIVLEPFFDIRFMYDPSIPDRHRASIDKNKLYVSAGDHTACIRADRARFTGNGRQISWEYKLGSGSRQMQDDTPRFVPEFRVVSSFYEIEAEGPEVALHFACGDSVSAAVALIGKDYGREDESRAVEIKEALFPGDMPVDRDVLFRALGMDRFGIMVDGVRFREAGDFWFRSVWFRDEFEGLLSNYRAIRATGGTAGMKAALLKAFDLQDDCGRVPNRLVPGGEGRKADYNSADATLLAFVLAGRLVRDTDDGDLGRSAAGAFRKYLKGIQQSDLAENGPPRIRPNGLISVPSWHSWTDGMRAVDGRSLPIRVDEAWERALIERNATEDLCLQKFFLPEICAQWMRALEAGWLFARYDRDFVMADECKKYYNRALGCYKALFLNPDRGCINNLVTTDDFALGRQTDKTPGSPGIVAAAMLGRDVFSLRELEDIVAFAKSRLMRSWRGMPFGIIVKDSPRGRYLGDPEYHEAVVWPRDTPYLVRLLRLTGDTATAEALLASNLRHQMEEGFVFYNQELFSCDHDLVPVKNPVQWWSQWVDPYLER